MPTLSSSLQHAIDQALTRAGEASQEYATPEHLLLELTQEESAREVMIAYSVDVEALGRGLDLYIDSKLSRLTSKPEKGPANPNPAFQRVVERAIRYTGSIGRDEASGAIALLSIFSEWGSQAAMSLLGQNLTRSEVVRFVHFGSRKDRIFEWTEPLTWSALTASLQNALNRALALANDRHHGAITLEHLLLALLSEEHARALLSDCGVKLEALKSDLERYIDEELSSLVMEGGEVNAQPSAACDRVIQRAITNLDSGTGIRPVTGDNLMVSLLDEPASHAVYLLQEQGLTLLDVVIHTFANGNNGGEPDGFELNPRSRFDDSTTKGVTRGLLGDQEAMQFTGKSGDQILEMLVGANTTDEFMHAARVLASLKLVGRTDLFAPVFKRLIAIQHKESVINRAIAFLNAEASRTGAEAGTPYWPDTFVDPSHGVVFIDALSEVKASALLISGYSVGHTSGLSQNERRGILRHFMEDPLHPGVRAIYGDQYGDPCSMERLLKVANVIATNCKNFKKQNSDDRYMVAISDYESDLAFLKQTYFDPMTAGRPPLPRPDTGI